MRSSFGRMCWIGLFAIALLAGGVAAATAQPADAQRASSEPEWALGIHANFPFLGISLRHWPNDRLGYELNLAPIPRCDPPDPVEPPEPGPPDEPRPIERPDYECPNRLELLTSARGLWRISDNPRADFYITAGPSATLRFGDENSPTLEEPFFATLAEIKIADWPIERVHPVVDYGFALNLSNVFDFRWIAGGVGFHYAF